MSGMWLLVLAVVLVIPLIMMGFGKAFMKKPPKRTNEAFAYKTKLSQKNDDTWEFAHKHHGKIWYRLGLILLLLSVVPMLALLGQPEEMLLGVGGLLCCIQVIPMFLSRIPTELALRKTFDREGNRKQP